MKKMLLICLFFIETIYSQFSWIDPKPTGYDLFSAFKFPNGISFAGGANGSLYNSTDDGITWRNKNTGTYGNISCIRFINENVGFIASDSGIFKTEDAGEHWQLQVAGLAFNRICFTNVNTGYIVSTQGVLYKTSDGGLSWSVIYIEKGIVDICFSDSLTGFIAGGSGFIDRTSDGGVKWYRCYSGGWYIYGIGFATNKYGTAVGWEGDYGTILSTIDGGLTWTKKIVMGYNKRVVFFDSLNGMLLGSSGWIFKTTNSGLDWTLTSASTGDVNDSYFVSQQNGILVGNKGNITRITNGSWEFITKRYYSPFRSFYFKNSKNGFATGEGLYRTTDGGDSWINIYLDWSFNPGITFIDENRGFLVGGSGNLISTNDGGLTWSHGTNLSSNTLYDINHSSASKLTIVGYAGNILTSSDAGVSWISRNSETTKTLYSIAILDSLNQIAVGDSGVILKSYNNGESWKSRGNIVTWQIRNIKVLNNKILFAVGGSLEPGHSGGIIKSTDGGETWIQIPGVYGDLNMISFADTVYGLAAGNYGTLLKTTDGGSSWVKISTGLQSNLYSVCYVDPYNALISGSGYNYGIDCLLKYSTSLPTSVIEYSEKIHFPDFHLQQNYPNPFNPSTTINFSIPVSGMVSLCVYNFLGRKISELINRELSAGFHSVQFNATGLPSGIYFYRMESGNYTITKKLVLLK